MVLVLTTCRASPPPLLGTATPITLDDLFVDTQAGLRRLSEQTKKLADAGVTIASSCTNAGLLARGFVEKGN